MKNFNNKDYKKTEKYVAITGDNFDSDRQFEIEANGVQIILCMDEQNRLIQILSADGEVISSKNTNIVEGCLQQVITSSRDATYTDKDEIFWSFYLDDIRPNSVCPEVDNESMYIIQAIDWNNIKAALII